MTFDPSSKLDMEHAGANADAYVDMGGIDSWVEFNINADAGALSSGNTCKLSFRYANGASNRSSRQCIVSVNSNIIGKLTFSTTISWTHWSYEDIDVICMSGTNKVRLTATTTEGGPNLDSMTLIESSPTNKISSPRHPQSTNRRTTFHTTPEIANAPSRKSCNSRYIKLPEGRITYGTDDGGCFLCVQHPVTKIPLSGDALIEECKRMCDEDIQCLAFTVARAASLPSQLHHFGKQANCCLERREYPPGVYLQSTEDDRVPTRTKCQLDRMCWTRFERDQEDVAIESREQCANHDFAITHLSNICLEVWEPTAYNDDEIQKAIDFIDRGCQLQDKIYVSMLATANARCKEEILAESMAISIIVHSSGMITYVSVGQ